MESEFYNRYTHITTKVHDTVLQLEPQPANPDDAYYQAAHRVEDAYIKFRNAVMLSFPVFSDKTLEIEAALKDKSFRDTYARATRKL